MKTPCLESRVQKLTDAIEKQVTALEEFQAECAEDVKQADMLIEQLQLPKELIELAGLSIDFDPDDYDLEAISKKFDELLHRLNENDKKQDEFFELLANCPCCESGKEVDEDSDMENIDASQKEEGKMDENGNDDVEMKEEKQFDAERCLLGYDSYSDLDYDTDESEESDSSIDLPDDSSSDDDYDRLGAALYKINFEIEKLKAEKNGNQIVEYTDSEDELIDKMSDLYHDQSQQLPSEDEIEQSAISSIYPDQTSPYMNLLN